MRKRTRAPTDTPALSDSCEHDINDPPGGHEKPTTSTRAHTHPHTHARARTHTHKHVPANTRGRTRVPIRRSSTLRRSITSRRPTRGRCSRRCASGSWRGGRRLRSTRAGRASTGAATPTRPRSTRCARARVRSERTTQHNERGNNEEGEERQQIKKEVPNARAARRAISTRRRGGARVQGWRERTLLSSSPRRRRLHCRARALVVAPREVRGNFAEWNFRVFKAEPEGSTSAPQLCARICQKLHAMQLVGSNKCVERAHSI